MAQGVAAEVKVLSKHSSIYGLANLLNRIVSFIMLPVYTRFLTPADYGVMDLIYFTTAFLGMVLEMGINAAMSRFYFDSEDQSERNLAISCAYYGFGVISTTLILCFMAGSGFLNHLIFKQNDYTNLLILGLASLGLDIYIQVGYNYLRVRQRSLNLTIVSISRLIMQLSLNILFVVYYKMGVKGVLLGTLIANSVLVAYLVPMTLRETGLRYSWPKLKAMIGYGLPLIPSNILSYIVNVSDRFFVNAYSGLTTTGIYSLGYRFGVLINEFVASPFSQIWMPRRFETFAREESERIFGRIFTYFCLLICFVGLGISVVTKDIIRLMSDKTYWDAYLVVPVIVLSYIVASFQMHFNIGILMQKKTKYIMYVNIITAAVNLVLNYFWIKSYGMWGAAYATLASFALKSSLMFVIGNRLVKIHVETARLIKLFALAGFLFWPLNAVDVGSSLANIAIKAVGCFLLPGILYVIRYFDADELRQGKTLAREQLGRIFPKLRAS